ncbi:MAG: response regulator [Myxococcota bacterium]|nr:response regulator [Myxococcales bacterium]
MRPRPLRLHDPREFPILYVDDEIENLRIFELTFRREFSVLTAQSAEDGLRALNENPVAVVLSDHKMPGMTGVDFLARVREIDEQAIRILVTAYGDAEILGSAINDGRIYRYVAKPWNPDDMRITLRRAIERYALDRERETLLSELTLLNRLSRSLHRELRPERVVERLIGAAHRELGFDGAAVLLFGADRSRLHWIGVAPHDDVAERVRRIELSRGTAPRFFEALEDGAAQTLSVDHWEELEGPVREWVAEVSADDLVVVPLPGEHEVIGALAIDNRSGGRRFGADDRTLLDGLSTQAVIALENARTVAALRGSRALAERVDRLGTVGALALGLVREMGDAVAELRAAVPQAAGLADRLGGMVGAIAELGAQADESSICEVAPGAIAEEVATLLAGEARRAGIALHVEADAQCPKLLAAPGQIRQVLLNLVMHVLRRAPTGGDVAIRSGTDAGEARVARLEVVGARAAVDPDDVERLLDPFATSDATSLEEGLGLRVAHELVRELGGTLEVSTDDASDTATLRVRLARDRSAGSLRTTG